MASPEVTFTRAPKMQVAYVEWRGPYEKIGEQMRRLKEWMDQKGVEQRGYPFCMFYDNPGETPAADLRSVACIPVARTTEPQGEFGFKDLPEADVAETRHEGPPEEFARTYGPFLEGLLRGGYRLEGPAREYFMSVADVRGPGTGFVIRQPISKK
ncbi:MAG: GyrI-like domain-containing protein [Nitrososphaerota archaeon]|nr:GyrI-like domain-containing protein [Nitrososphaerota archaeon]